MSVELVLDARAELGEGPVWHAEGGLLYWLDITAGAVHAFDPESGADRAITVGRPVGSLAVRQRGGLVLALRDGFALLDTRSEALEHLEDPEPDRPDNRMNDGKCDPAGRFWAGSMAADGRTPKAGGLYCLAPDHSVTRKLDGVWISNGLAWSRDAATLFYIDTPTGSIDAFDYDAASGAISGRRPVLRVARGDGFPDGMTIDAEDRLWVAHWDGGCLIRYDPASGAALARLDLPVTRPTSCAFGGPDLRTLFITTAREGLDADALTAQPHAGSLFAARVDVPGLPAAEFAG